MDPALVQAAQGGDALALDQLLDELVPMVHRLSTAVAPTIADDATQESLILIFRNIRRLRQPEAILSWTRRLTVRTAVRLARAQRLDYEIEPKVDPHRVSVEHLVDVSDALRRLPPEYRAVIALRTIEGLTERETAILLRIPVGTVKSRLSRARAALREEWNA